MRRFQSGHWRDSGGIRSLLIGDGWLTPNTYCNCFAMPKDEPAVYLLLLAKGHSMGESLVAYVGMSTRLRQRLTGHPVLAKIDQPGYWPSQWFKRVARADLRKVEAHYIAAFDPPWNIVGRTRGIPLLAEASA